LKPRFNHQELDAFRAFAFLMVFCGHTPYPARWFETVQQIGGFGVTLFFTLSAYLIITLLLREKDHTGTVRLGAFAMRRILRILPLFYLVIALGYLAGHHWPNIQIQSDAIIALVLMYGNVFVAHHGWTHTGILNPLWSISIEVQFYLAIPLLVWLGGRRAVWAVCSATIVVAYIVLFRMGLHAAIASTSVWANSFVQFQFFAAGGVIALLSFRRKISPTIPWRCILAASAPVLFYVAAMTCTPRSNAPTSIPMLFCGYACALAGTTAAFLSILNIPHKIPYPLVYLGKISYGLYLFHFALLWFTFSSVGRRSPALIANSHPLVATALVLAATILFAALSYELFEKPILRWKQRFETEKTRI
jgi:peptidoglycan/LPS O-acetylase OafA/YrhL